MVTAYKIHSAIRAARIGDGSDGALLGEVVRLVRGGGVLSVELEARMSAAGLDLDHLHRCLIASGRAGI
jgi:hypothetical protein